MKANWIVAALLTCATNVAGAPNSPRAAPSVQLPAPPQTPTASPCVLGGKLALRVKAGKSTAVRLETKSNRSTFEASFQPLSKQLRRQLSRGLPMTLEVTAQLLDGQNQLLSRLDHACHVKWLLWDEVYSIETWTNGQRKERTSPTADGVVRACLGIDAWSDSGSARTRRVGGSTPRGFAFHRFDCRPSLPRANLAKTAVAPDHPR